jgi:polyhydroxyalkanoate synthesis regulator phasin
MAEAKKGSGSKRAGKKSSAKKSSAKKSSAKKSSAKKSSAKKAASSAPRKRAAKKGGQARGRKQSAKKQATKAAATATAPAAAMGDFSGKAVAEFRQALTSNLIRPLEMVMLSRQRIEDALDEVVTRGRMTRDDATQLGQALFTLGRQQTDDVMKDLEQLLGRGRSQLEARSGNAGKRGAEAARGARKSVSQAADAARKAADPLLARADQARRAAGVGPSFPITGYDDLTAAQIQGRLDTLTPAELRKVRDYERRRGNRKSVLEAIEAKL